MTIHVGIYEARTDFSRLIALVESGEEDVIVTRHGKPVAHIVAPEAHLQTPQQMLDEDAEFEQRWRRWEAEKKALNALRGDSPNVTDQALEWLREGREGS